MRSNAWTIGAAVCLAILGGVLPDLISHGVILAGRGGHFELAIIGAFLAAAGMFWFVLSYALVRRYGAASEGAVVMVNCPKYRAEFPISVCRKCGQCRNREV
jgi:hypothetical protein